MMTIDKKNSIKKNNERKANNNNKNKDLSWYKNQIKSNFKGWIWKKKSKQNI